MWSNPRLLLIPHTKNSYFVKLSKTNEGGSRCIFRNVDITWFDKYEKTLPCLWNKAFSVNRKNTKFSFHANQLASTNIQLQSWQAYKLTRPKEEFLWKVSKTFKVVARSSRFVFMTPKWNHCRKMGESSAIWICQNNFAKMTPLRPYLTYTFLSDKSEESTSSWILLFVFVFFCRTNSSFLLITFITEY